MNKLSPRVRQNINQELRFVMFAFAAISIALYIYNALTIEPPYTSQALLLYGVLTIVLISLFSVGISRWEDLFIKHSLKLIVVVAILGVIALFGASFVSQGRIEILYLATYHFNK